LIKLCLGWNWLLTKPNEIGHGYQDQGAVVSILKSKTLTWHFKAPMVHDFTWAADKIIFMILPKVKQC
jgi:hypothetical protein